MIGTFSLEEIMAALRARRERTEWGPWRYRASNRTLECCDEGGYCFYYVDLDRCCTSAQVLDWIFQVHGKTWATPEIMGGLLEALDDLLSPQANLCSFGQNRRVDPHELLAGRPGYEDGGR